MRQNIQSERSNWLKTLYSKRKIPANSNRNVSDGEELSMHCCCCVGCVFLCDVSGVGDSRVQAVDKISALYF